MKNKAEIIKGLKELTVAEKEEGSFANAMNYFFDHIADTSLRDDGEPLEENIKFYVELLKPVAQYFGIDRESYVSFMLLKKMNGAEFVHGTACLSNGTNVVFYFFGDINVGIATALSFTSQQCDYFRLSLKIMRPIATYN
jgi:hypothetical protein